MTNMEISSGKIKLTILCDNWFEKQPKLRGEHGFACLVETGEKRLLFDTGNGEGLLHNAACCGVDLRQLDGVILSHGHWDHCGGLMGLLGARKGLNTRVYTHPELFAPRFSRRGDLKRDIGCGFRREEAESAGADFCFNRTAVELAPGVLLSGEVPRLVEMAGDRGLYRQQGIHLAVDELPDDQSLYLHTTAGLTVLCGCAHAGIGNILDHARQLTKMERLHALVGGTHLSFLDAEQEAQALEQIVAMQPQELVLAHCSGMRACGRLIGATKAQWVGSGVGTQLVI